MDKNKKKKKGFAYCLLIFYFLKSEFSIDHPKSNDADVLYKFIFMMIVCFAYGHRSIYFDATVVNYWHLTAFHGSTLCSRLRYEQTMK